MHTFIFAHIVLFYFTVAGAGTGTGGRYSGKQGSADD